MSKTALVPVAFHGATLFAFTVDGAPHVALRPICEALGIDWEAQRLRIRRHPVLNETACVTKAVAADGKEREVVTLPLNLLNGWLFGVSVNRVKPELRDKLISYQRECFDVLARHFGATGPAAYTARPADKLSSGEQEILRDMLTTAVKRLPPASQAGAMVKGWSKLKAHFGVGYRDIPAEQFTDAVSLLARHITEWELLDAPRRCHFPLESADPHDRRFANAWLSPRVLVDPANRAPELELLDQLEKDGHDVTGAKLRVLAMRSAMGQAEEAREALRAIKERLGPVLEICTVALHERGKNVIFAGRPDPASPIDRHVYPDQLQPRKR